MVISLTPNSVASRSMRTAPVSLIRCSIRLSRSYWLLGATAAMDPSV